MSNNNIQIHKITQGVVYLDGVTQLGKVETVQVDDLKFLFDQFKALGMIGKIELPIHGVDIGKGKMKFNSLYPAVAKSLHPFKPKQLQIRSSVIEYGEGGVKLREVPLVTFVTVLVKNVPMGKFEQHKSIEFEYDFTYTYIKQVYDGEEILEYDALGNVLKVGGVDLMEEYRNNVM